MEALASHLVKFFFHNRDGRMAEWRAFKPTHIVLRQTKDTGYLWMRLEYVKESYRDYLNSEFHCLKSARGPEAMARWMNFEKLLRGKMI